MQFLICIIHLYIKDMIKEKRYQALTSAEGLTFYKALSYYFFLGFNTSWLEHRAVNILILQVRKPRLLIF